MELEQARDRMVLDMLKSSVRLCAENGAFHDHAPVCICLGDGEILAEGIVCLFPQGVGVQMTRPMELYTYRAGTGDAAGLASEILAGMYVDWMTLMQNRERILSRLKDYPAYERKYREEHPGSGHRGDPFGQFFAQELSKFFYCGNPRMLIYNLENMEKTKTL